MSSLRTFDRPGRRLVPGPTLPAPPVPETHQIARAAAHLLVTSGLCLALVSWAVPDTYSVIEHTLSEAAGQGVRGGWLARTGMILAAFAAVLLSVTPSLRWGPWSRLAHRLFGVFAVFIAIFEDGSFIEGETDPVEAWLHTVVTVAAGVAFVLGVLLVMVEGRRLGRIPAAFDQVAILAPLVLPVVMLRVDGIDGLAQRLMLAAGLWWYWLEARSVLAGQAEWRPRRHR